MSWLLVITLAGGLAGLGLLTIGLRGTLSDRHPVCRRCRYDLIGIWPSAASCPECGADLTRARSLRRGNRRRRPSLLVYGCGLLTVAASIGGAIGWGAATKFNWNQVKPVWLLLHETEVTDTPTVSAALTELHSRYSANRLNHETTMRLVQRGIEVQADPTQLWLPGWGNLVEAAWIDGLLTDDQKSNYARHCAPSQLEVRSTVRAGDSIPIDLVVPPRLGDSFLFYLRVKLVSAKIDDRHALRIGRLARTSPPIKGDYSASVITIGPVRFSEQVYKTLASGTHAIQTSWRLKVLDYQAGQERLTQMREKIREGSFSRVDLDMTDLVLAEWTVECGAQFQVIPQTEESVSFFEDESLYPAVQKAVRGAHVQDWSSGVGGPYLNVYVAIEGAPADLAFRVLVRSGGREWPITSIAAPAGDDWHQVQSSALAPDFPTSVTSVDVVLRSDLDVARKTATLKRVWKGEIVISDVAVSRPEFGSGELQDAD